MKKQFLLFKYKYIINKREVQAWHHYYILTSKEDTPGLRRSIRMELAAKYHRRNKRFYGSVSVKLVKVTNEKILKNFIRFQVDDIDKKIMELSEELFQLEKDKNGLLRSNIYGM